MSDVVDHFNYRLNNGWHPNLFIIKNELANAFNLPCELADLVWSKAYGRFFCRPFDDFFALVRDYADFAEVANFQQRGDGDVGVRPETAAIRPATGR